MIKIMFVCHGNICRSPMAEFVLKDIVKKRGIDNLLEIASCATSREEIGNGIHHGTKSKLTKMNIAFSNRKAVQLTERDYEYYDYILCMERYNIQNVLRIIRTDDENKIKRLLDFSNNPRDIADPWYTGNFDETYEDILEGCHALLNYLFA